MFKLVVLCAFVVAAVADPKPGVLLTEGLVQPYAAVSTLVSPASTSISSQFSSVVHPTPITYSTHLGFSHLLKKRSPQWLAPAWNSAWNYPYNAAAVPVVSTSPLATPIAYSNLEVPLATHLIKKRSAQLLPTSYISPTTYISNPAISPVVSTPYIHNPYYYGANVPLLNAHLIKKRSADPQLIPTTYLAPSTYINTLATTPYLSSPLVSTVYSAPTTLPLATTHLIKKRSADPQLISTIPSLPTTYYAGSPWISTYNSALIKSGPIIASDPFLYSTLIKK